MYRRTKSDVNHLTDRKKMYSKISAVFVKFVFVEDIDIFLRQHCLNHKQGNSSSAACE